MRSLLEGKAGIAIIAVLSVVIILGLVSLILRTTAEERAFLILLLMSTIGPACLISWLVALCKR